MEGGLLVPVASYLESGIMTLVIPLGILALVGIYWVVVVRRHPEEF
jgi:hypothetical protein